MASAKNWLREELRKTLGDWVAVCLGCGFAVRYVEEGEAELPVACPQCEGELRFRCAECSANPYWPFGDSVMGSPPKSALRSEPSHFTDCRPVAAPPPPPRPPAGACGATMPPPEP